MGLAALVLFACVAYSCWFFYNVLKAESDYRQEQEDYEDYLR